MDSSKMVEGSSEECSSSESGWTMYIGSPEDQEDHGGDGDDDDDDVAGVEECRHGKDIADENVDSDDSMASDASSGPSGMHIRGYERKYVGVQEEKEKKKKKKDDEERKIKTEKEHRSGNKGKSAGKSKKT